MSKTAVIGGAGFLGSHLVDLLLEKTQDEVICIDDLSTGQMTNLAKAEKNPRFSFKKMDILDAPLLRTALKDVGRIAHMAAAKIPRYGGRLETLRTNSLGTLNVLEAARERKARVLLASTSDVYGRNPETPFSEETSASVLGSSTSARWAYAVSKLFDEQLFFAYEEAHQLPVSIVRIFGSYGPRHNLTWRGGPQAVFIAAILKGEGVELHGDGSQTRSLCYVDDTVAGLFAALTSEHALGKIINIGSTEEIAIKDLARKIQALIHGDAAALQYTLVPLAQFSRNYEDVKRRVPDISLASQLLGWKPLFTLEEGLKRTIDWQRQKVHADS